MAKARKHPDARVRHDGRDALWGWLAATTALAAAAVATPALGASAEAGGEGAPSSTPPSSTPLADGPQLAQADDAVTFDIPAQPLPAALNAFGRQAGLQVTVEAAIAAGASSQGVQGSYTPAQALDRLLAGTGIVWRMSGADTVVLERPAGSGIVLDPLTVEGAAGAEARFGDTPPEPGGFAAEYQTSATKMGLPIRETPKAISVITRDSIETRQARDVASALELAAGVTAGLFGNGGPFAGRGPNGGEAFTLRGQELNGNRDVRIDGFAVGSKFNAFDIAAFERVEAVKGPASMLYGQGSLGGFINLVRKQPQAAFEASGVAQVGSFDTYRAEADVTGALDPDERLSGRLTGAYDDAGSFIDGVKTRVAMVAPSLEARVGEDTRVLLQLLYQDDEFIPTNGIPLRIVGNELRIPEISRSLFVGLPSQQSSSSQAFHGVLRVDHELSDRWLGSVLLQKSRSDHTSILDSYGYGLAANGDVGLYSGLIENETDNWAGELRLDGRFDAFGREHRLLAGTERNERNDRFAFGYAALGTANLYAGDFANVPTLPGGGLGTPIVSDVTSTNTNTAVYGQVSLSVLERTRLLVGARYDWADQEAQSNLTSDITGQKLDEALTLQFGLTQDLSDNVTAYAVYAQSFNPVNAQSQTGAILDPETGEGYEAGLKTAWFEDKLAASVAVFQQDLDNRPITDPGNINFSISGGLERTRGLELEVSGSPLPGLTIGMASAWLDSEFIDPLDENFGFTPLGVVDRQTSLFAGYRIQQGDFRGLGFGAMVLSVGDRSFDTSFSAGGQSQFLGGYERVDLNLYYDGLPGWDMSLQVRNVLDATYIETIGAAAGQSNIFGSPRALLVRVKATF